MMNSKKFVEKEVMTIEAIAWHMPARPEENHIIICQESKYPNHGSNRVQLE
jgi:hypothetical protein